MLQNNDIELDKFRVEFSEYSNILENLGIQYKEHELWLQSGISDFQDKWILFVSSKTVFALAVLENVLPLLIKENAPFLVIKNQLLHYQINAGVFGISEVGKMLTIFTSNQEQAKRIASNITKLVASFEGPAIAGTIKLANILYAAFSQISYSEHLKVVNLTIPRKAHIPFDRFKFVKGKEKRLIGNKYVPIEIYRETAKGHNYKCINVGNLSFRTCFIKEGRANTVDDQLGRDMRDRLEWQKKVLQDLFGKLPVPKVLDFIREGNDLYLVMQHIDGMTLSRMIRKYVSPENIPSKEKQLEFLSIFREIVCHVRSIHKAGYIHRDITADNFIVTNSNKIYLVDFELSYSVNRQFPDPPFVLGTEGYMAPEQLNYSKPSFKEDIYSLGALLLFILTGKLPIGEIKEDYCETKRNVRAIIEAPLLSTLVLRCVNPNPEYRPGLEEMILTVDSGIESLVQNKIYSSETAA